MSANTVRIEKAGRVAHLVLDDQGAKVNTLGTGSIGELEAAFDLMEKDGEIDAVVVRSAKPGNFIAGADVKELAGMSRSPQAHDLGLQAARRGQGLMNRIEDFPKPVVAGINGACLGGGLELALACHARVVTREDSTRLGLPELKLGILPGFGGTWRLPRLLGLARGIEFILSSRSASGKEAVRMGLADDLCFREQVGQAAGELALKLRKPGFKGKLAKKRRTGSRLSMRVLGWPVVRRLLISRVRAEVIRKTGGLMPAPLLFLKVVSRSLWRGRAEALKLEAEALASLLATIESRNLVRLFLNTTEAKKQGADKSAGKIRAAGVVGSGLMGAGIALALTSRARIRTVLVDTDLKVLGRALKKIWDAGRKRVRRHQWDEVDATKSFNLVSTTTDYGALRDVGLVIEAVPEIMDLKRKVFTGLERAVGPDTILASNTSSLSITGMAEGAVYPGRFVGMHFFMPAEVMPLVEVIPGRATTPEAVAAAVRTAVALDKVPVVVKDTPGFLVNRVLAAYALEAAQMVEEGVPPSAVDAAARRFGMPMGPIRLVGEVGVGVMTKVLHQIRGAYGDHMADPGWIGRADLGAAFTRGPDGKWSVNEEVIREWTGKADPGYSVSDLQDRLYTAMLNESVLSLEEGVAATPADLDLAMVYGIGFPPQRGGPLAEADARGLARVVERAEGLAGRFGRRLAPPSILKKMVAAGESFFGAEVKP